jgi:hypothetical protein
MSTAWARTYDWAVPITPSSTTDDPSGPFAGLLVTAAGDLSVWPLNGPQGSLPLTMVVIAGQELHFPIRRVNVSGGAVAFGLVSGIVRQGP